MNCLLDTRMIPHELQLLGVKVWVGDQMVGAEVLKKQQLRTISVLRYKDVAREIGVLFAVPTSSRIGAIELTKCREFALKWVGQWEVGERFLAYTAHHPTPPEGKPD
jgi:hypothetical protein